MSIFLTDPESGKVIEAVELKAGDTIQQGDLCQIYGGEYVEWPELIDYTLPSNHEMPWVRPLRG